MVWVTFQCTGLENRVSGVVYTSFSIFALVVATIRSLTVNVSLREGGNGISSKYKGCLFALLLISPLNGYRHYDPRGYSGWGVKLATHLCLEPRSMMVELYP
jgi:hypothetical protein